MFYLAWHASVQLCELLLRRAPAEGRILPRSAIGERHQGCQMQEHAGVRTLRRKLPALSTWVAYSVTYASHGFLARAFEDAQGWDTSRATAAPIPPKPRRNTTIIRVLSSPFMMVPGLVEVRKHADEPDAL